jgi:hypothetical protein
MILVQCMIWIVCDPFWIFICCYLKYSLKWHKCNEVKTLWTENFSFAAYTYICIYCKLVISSLILPIHVNVKLISTIYTRYLVTLLHISYIIQSFVIFEFNSKVVTFRSEIVTNYLYRVLGNGLPRTPGWVHQGKCGRKPLYRFG